MFLGSPRDRSGLARSQMKMSAMAMVVLHLIYWVTPGVWNRSEGDVENVRPAPSDSRMRQGGRGKDWRPEP